MSRFVAVFIGLLSLVATAEAKPTTTQETYAAGGKLTQACDKFCTSSLTGKSPWLVMGLGGAYRYYQAYGDEDRSKNLGLFGKPAVFGPILLLVALVLAKDFLLTWLGFLKAPLNALAELLHMSGGVLALAYLGESAGNFGGSPPAEYASLAAPLPDAQIEAASPWMKALLFLSMATVHAAVWIVFNTVEVAVILNPFPLVDSALKSFRTAIIAVISGAAEVHPLFGFLLAAPIVLLCIVLLPLAVRFAVLGWVFSKDTLLGLFRRRVPPAEPTRAFASWKLPGVRLFSYGRVEATEAGLVFVYRPGWILWTRRVPLPPTRMAIGFLSPSLASSDADGSQWSLVRFPPRYAGLERELAAKLGISEVVDASLTASLKQLWRRCRAWAFGASTDPAQHSRMSP